MTIDIKNEKFNSLRFGYNWMFEKKLALGIIDTSEKINDDFLRAISKNIVEYWFQEIIKTTIDYIDDMPNILKIHSDPDEIIKWASESNYEYVLVASLGTSFKNTGTEFFTVLEKFLNETPQDDITIVGHILDKKDEYYQLHHQTFLVNLDWWRKNGQPKLGQENNSKKILSEVNRSSDNHHDDYTPLWIEKGSSKKEYTKTHFGWNIIETALQSNKRVLSFNKNLRRSKYYLYPEVKSDAYTKKNYITKWIMTMSKHFIANTESFWQVHDNNFDSIVCSAGGISPILTGFFTNLKPNSQILVADINHFSLVCQKKIVDALINKTITVNQIEQFLREMTNEYSIDNNGYDMFSADNKISNMQEEINQHSNELQNFVDNILPNIEIEYKQIDYFDDAPSIAGRIEKLLKDRKKVYINFSNIFHYYPTSLLYNYEDRYNLYKRLLVSLYQKDPNKYYTTREGYPIKKLIDNDYKEYDIMMFKKHFEKVKPKWKK